MWMLREEHEAHAPPTMSKTFFAIIIKVIIGIIIISIIDDFGEHISCILDLGMVRLVWKEAPVGVSVSTLNLVSYSLPCPSFIHFRIRK